MTTYRRDIMNLFRPEMKGPVTGDFVERFDTLLDRCGIPRDGPDPAAEPAPAVVVILDVPADGSAATATATAAAAAPVAPAAPAGRLDVAGLRQRLGLATGGGFDKAARAALFARLSNTQAPALTEDDFQRVADELGVAPSIIKAVRKVEAPRGPFDDQGRPSILYEKHVFARNTVPKGKFNASNPVLSAASWQPGTYGAFSAQYGKLADACALDPEAALRACSWGAFQVLGENAASIGYASTFEMALALTESEAAHLECFVRFIRSKGLITALKAAKPGNAASCVAFVKGYNGNGYAQNQYHIKLAQAAL
ncbi:MAG: hypothetical protein QOC65_660 [Sphingomonadales bacterium]|nr:hypothetical protein [Sphingomonadales bacterium]